MLSEADSLSVRQPAESQKTLELGASFSVSRSPVALTLSLSLASLFSRHFKFQRPANYFHLMDIIISMMMAMMIIIIFPIRAEWNVRRTSQIETSTTDDKSLPMCVCV